MEKVRTSENEYNNQEKSVPELCLNNTKKNTPFFEFINNA